MTCRDEINKFCSWFALVSIELPLEEAFIKVSFEVNSLEVSAWLEIQLTFSSIVSLCIYVFLDDWIIRFVDCLRLFI